MRCVTLFICFLCFIITYSTCNAQMIAMAARGIQFLYQVYQYETTKTKDEKLTEQINYVNMINSIEELKLKIEKLQSDAPDVINMKARMNELQEESDAITERYDEGIRYSKNESIYDSSTLEDFYTEVMNENEGVPKLLFNIHEKIVGLGTGSLLNIMDRFVEYIEPYCQKRKSRQRYFYNLFISVASHEIRGFLTLEYAYNLKKKMENKTLKQEYKDLLELYQTRINETLTAFKDVMSRTEPEIWKCDPNQHAEDKTYVELKNVFQRVFYSAKDFSWNYNSISCTSEACPEIREGKYLKPKCEIGACSLHQRTCNAIAMCRQITRKESYDVCVSKKQDHGRRYSHVKQAGGAYFQSHATCSGTSAWVYRNVESFPGGASESVCNMCDCICDESQNSDRYISLKPVTSDTINNYVVTGVQFELVNHTLYIKIQQGQLLPYGFIDSSSVGWKDIVIASDDQDNSEQLSIDLIKKNNKNETSSHPSVNSGSSGFYKFEGREKFKLEWHHRRGLYLDDLELKKGEVVTGVRFSLDVTKTGDIYVMLDLQATPFNFPAGKLMTENSTWLSNYATVLNRTQLSLHSNDMPIFLKVINKPDDIPHKYTEFAPSALTSKDAGQTLLPLIDIQPVTSDPPVPLMGVSLDIKRAENSGGFLILKIKTYDTLWNLNDP